jgi:hypothetical protein
MPGRHERLTASLHPNQHQKGKAMEQQCSHEDVSILYELDLGQHTLFLLEDSSMDLLANEEQTPYLADNGVSLDSDETYRLFISLHEHFKQRQAAIRQSEYIARERG